MKLKKILNEIGDSSQIPSAAQFNVSENKGQVKFKIDDLYYTIEIRIPILQNNVLALTIDFYTTNDGGRFNSDSYNLTNKGQAIKLMSYVVGSIEEWLKRYSKKYGEIQIVYIKYEPKSESEETQSIDSIKNDDVVNKRDKLYRAYLEKFAKKYGSSVTFKVAGGINANFNPRLKI